MNDSFSLDTEKRKEFISQILNEDEDDHEQAGEPSFVISYLSGPVHKVLQEAAKFMESEEEISTPDIITPFTDIQETIRKESAFKNDPNPMQAAPDWSANETQALDRISNSTRPFVKLLGPLGSLEECRSIPFVVGSQDDLSSFSIDVSEIEMILDQFEAGTYDLSNSIGAYDVSNSHIRQSPVTSSYNQCMDWDAIMEYLMDERMATNKNDFLFPKLLPQMRS